jgi:flagellar hook-associated protein 3 FlgL
MTSISTSGQFFRMRTNNLDVQERLAELRDQVATQKKTTVYGGLGGEARVSIGLRAEVRELETYRANVDKARLRASTSIETLERVSKVAKDISVELIKLQSDVNGDPAILRDIARRAFEELKGLYNTRANGEYVLAGTDQDNPPLPSASADDMLAAIEADFQTAELDPLASPNRALVASHFRARGLQPTSPPIAVALPPLAAASQVFSNALEQPLATNVVDRSAARVDRGLDVTYGVLATGGSASADIAAPASDAAPPASLPALREILRGIASIVALPTPANETEVASMKAFAAQVQRGLDGAAREVDQDVGRVGSAMKHMDAVATRHKDVEVVLTQGVKDVEDVDMAEAITRLQLTQTQLEASYRATASLNRTNLNDYL